jgi:tape measure domain-containing protein
MAKRNSDVELRIRSKNQGASKDIRDINAELDALTKTQERQADASALATRSLKDLNAEQRELAKITSDLTRRRNVIENLIGKQNELAATKNRINAIRKELAGLLQEKTRGTFLGDIDKAIKNVRTELSAAEKDFKRTDTQVEKLGASLTELGVDTNKLDSALSEVSATLNKAQAATIDQVGQINRLGAASDQAAASARKLAEAQRFANEQAQRQTARRADAVAGFANLDNYTKERNLINARNAAMQESINRAARLDAVLSRPGNERYTRTLQQTVPAANAAASATRRYGNEVQRASKEQGFFADTGRKSLSVYQRLRGQVLQVAAAYVGLYEGVRLLGSAMTAQQTRASLNAQLGTVNGGDLRRTAEDQRFLRAEAERLGLVYDDLAKKFANFAISGKAAGISSNGIKEAFTQASEIIVGMRLTAEDADGVFRAFVQIMSKARVQAEELRGQLGDRLPGAVAAFAKANDLALSDLDEYLKKGQGNVQSFLNFLKEYADTVKGSVEAGSKTLFADINRLKTAYNDFLVLVAESGSSEALQTAVRQLTDALKGEQGAKFARDLGDAFATVIKALQIVITYFDEFVLVTKLFIGLQVAKGLFGIAVAFGQVTKSLITSTKFMKAFTVSTVAANTAGKALTLTQRGLLLLLGPVGVALGIAAGALLGLARAADKANERAEIFLDTLSKVEKASDTFDLDIAVSEAEAQLEVTNKSLQDMIALRDRLTKGSFVDKNLVAPVEAFVDNIYTMEMVEERITEEKSKQAALQNTINAAAAKRVRLSEQEAEAERKRAEEDAAAAKAAAGSGSGTEDEEDPGKAARDAEAARKREESSANARANAARAVQKELLDLDQQLYDARVQGEARTAEEVDRNYNLMIRNIESQIAEKQLELDRLAQNSATAGGGTASAADLAGIAEAQQKLDLLRSVLNQRAYETSLLQEMQIAEKSVNDLIDERDAKIAAINTKQQLGLLTEVEARREAMAVQEQYSARIAENIDALIALLEALPPDISARLGVPKLILDLQSAKLEATTLKSELSMIGEKLGGEFASGAADAIVLLGQGLGDLILGVGSVEDAFTNALNSFRSFLSNFLAGIAQAILQAIILQAIMNAINGTKGGFGAAVAGALGVKNHDGGIVGRDGAVGWYPADAWKNAKRHHDGGVAGVKSNEVATILEKGEEVLTENDPRHVNNGGGGTPVIKLTNVNTFDKNEVAGMVLQSAAFGPAVVNAISKNATAVKQRLRS